MNNQASLLIVILCRGTVFESDLVVDKITLTCFNRITIVIMAQYFGNYLHEEFPESID